MIKTMIRILSLIAAFFVVSAIAQDKIAQPDYPLGGGDEVHALHPNILQRLIGSSRVAMLDSVLRSS